MGMYLRSAKNPRTWARLDAALIREKIVNICVIRETPPVCLGWIRAVGGRRT